MITLPKGVRGLALLCGAVWALESSAQTAAIPSGTNAATATLVRSTEEIVLPPSIPDPLEPFNRAMWAVNRDLMTWVIQPTSKAYRFVVRKPIRTGIGNLGRNVLYPGRLLNNLLQGRWRGARDETDRFFCNSVLGGGGLVDWASRWGIPKSDADFGQTLGKWGWRPGCFLMLPVLGPSNERDALGLVADTASDPLHYVTPRASGGDDPLSWISPYTYFSYGVVYNNLSDSVDGYVRLAESETDPYSLVRYAWTFVRHNRAPSSELTEDTDPAALDTLGAVAVTFKDSAFPERERIRSVRIPGTGRKLKFSLWLQPHPAPMVYLVPGLGSHRITDMTLALAELAYQHGSSVACVSSPYHGEFMSQASTAAVPGYTAVDAHDLHVALTEIDHFITAQYPDRIRSRALMGYSMGGFHTLFLAGSEPTQDASLVRFDRFVAINAPVRLSYGMSKLDEFYNAPLGWPSDQRARRMENALLKIATTTQGGPTPPSGFTYSALESKFLIGLTFRFKLRDVIFSSQQRTNLGVLRQPLRNRRREPAYEEILRYSYADYFQRFAAPYYQSRGVDLSSPGALDRAGDLRVYADSFRGSSKVRVVTNENDFLLPTEDLEWYRANLGPERLTVFKRGGHMGNLGDHEVQQAILRALDAP